MNFKVGVNHGGRIGAPKKLPVIGEVATFVVWIFS
jgi:hypothetical protein